QSISIEAVREKGYEKMPKYGWMPVTVPGAPSAWVELSERFGKLPLTEVLQPAIDYAAEGYPLSPTLAKFWRRAHRIFKENLKEEHFKGWFDTFTPQDRVPQEIGRASCRERKEKMDRAEIERRDEE